MTNNSIQGHINSGKNGKQIEMTLNAESLGFQIESYLYWKTHIEYMISKLSEVCYAIRSIHHISNNDIMK